MHFTRHIDHLRQRLQAPLPGTSAQFTMAPHYRQDASQASIRNKPCREAGVLALLFPLEAQPAVLLTVRRPTLKQHAGQVSFPGGRREEGESLVETALRETEEELCLPPHDIEILGNLTPLYIPPSNFCVHLFVGAISTLPDLQPEEAEVETILHVPIAHLQHPQTHVREPWLLHGRTIEVPFFSVTPHKIWGATAMMLAELLAVLPTPAPTSAGA